MSTVTGDRYADEWPREQFRAHGITYKTADLDRSGLYLEPRDRHVGLHGEAWYRDRPVARDVD